MPRKTKAKKEAAPKNPRARRGRAGGGRASNYRPITNNIFLHGVPNGNTISPLLTLPSTVHNQVTTPAATAAGTVTSTPTKQPSISSYSLPTMAVKTTKVLPSMLPVLRRAPSTTVSSGIQAAPTAPPRRPPTQVGDLRLEQRLTEPHNNVGTAARAAPLTRSLRDEIVNLRKRNSGFSEKYLKTVLREKDTKIDAAQTLDPSLIKRINPPQ